MNFYVYICSGCERTLFVFIWITWECLKFISILSESFCISTKIMNLYLCIILFIQFVKLSLQSIKNTVKHLKLHEMIFIETRAILKWRLSRFSHLRSNKKSVTIIPHNYSPIIISHIIFCIIWCIINSW